MKWCLGGKSLPRGAFPQQQTGGQGEGEEEEEEEEEHAGPCASCPPPGSPTLSVPWGDGGLKLFWELLPALPLCCWLLGMGFSPSVLGAPAGVPEQNPPGQG